MNLTLQSVKTVLFLYMCGTHAMYGTRENSCYVLSCLHLSSKGSKYCTGYGTVFVIGTVHTGTGTISGTVSDLSLNIFICTYIVYDKQLSIFVRITH